MIWLRHRSRADWLLAASLGTFAAAMLVVVASYEAGMPGGSDLLPNVVGSPPSCSATLAHDPASTVSCDTHDPASLAALLSARSAYAARWQPPTIPAFAACLSLALGVVLIARLRVRRRLRLLRVR